MNKRKTTENYDRRITMKKINIRDIKESPVKLISDDWALLTAGRGKEFNTMTVSWGAAGELWGRDSVFVFVRPQRYTFEFIENSELFTLSFYPEEYKDALRICGRKSGRDINKPAETGLTPVETDGAVTFEQAKYTIVCRKIASQYLDPAGFIDKTIEENYSNNDYHKMYVGEIIAVYEH